MSMSTTAQHSNALQAEQELREQARRPTAAATAGATKHAAPTAPQARRTWLAIFGDMTLPTIESSVEWTAWSQQSIDETEAQIRKVCRPPLTSITSSRLHLTPLPAAAAAATTAKEQSHADAWEVNPAHAGEESDQEP